MWWWQQCSIFLFESLSWKNDNWFYCSFNKIVGSIQRVSRKLVFISNHSLFLFVCLLSALLSGALVWMLFQCVAQWKACCSFSPVQSDLYSDTFMHYIPPILVINFNFDTTDSFQTWLMNSKCHYIYMWKPIITRCCMSFQQHWIRTVKNNFTETALTSTNCESSLYKSHFYKLTMKYVTIIPFSLHDLLDLSLEKELCLQSEKLSLYESPAPFFDLLHL